MPTHTAKTRTDLTTLEAEMTTTETTEATDTRLTVLRSHDMAIAKLQPALQYDITTDPKAVDRARKDAKQVRCRIEEARKRLVEDAVAWQREVNAVAKDITSRVTPIEEHCERIEAEHAAEKKRKAEEAAAAEQARKVAARIAEAEALQISDEGKARVMGELRLHAALDTPEQWDIRVANAAQIDERIAEAKAAAAAREAEERRLQAEREELARQRAEIEAERKRLADEQAKREAEERAKRQAEAAEQRRIAMEEARRQQEEEERKAAELARQRTEEYAKDQQEREAANAKATQAMIEFVRQVHSIRPTPKTADIGPQLELTVLRGIHDLAEYLHDHIRDHYDARKDV
jgi:hypothetical protein